MRTQRATGEKNTNYINELPDELLLAIFHIVAKQAGARTKSEHARIGQKIQAMINIIGTSRRFRGIAYDRTLWGLEATAIATRIHSDTARNANQGAGEGGADADSKSPDDENTLAKRDPTIRFHQATFDRFISLARRALPLERQHEVLQQKVVNQQSGLHVAVETRTTFRALSTQLKASIIPFIFFSIIGLICLTYSKTKAATALIIVGATLSLCCCSLIALKTCRLDERVLSRLLSRNRTARDDVEEQRAALLNTDNNDDNTANEYGTTLTTS